MEIESLRLDFQPIHIKEKPTQNISEKNPEKEEKKKKNRTKREEPRSEKNLEKEEKKKSEQREKNPDQRKERKNLEKAHSSPHQHSLGLAWPGLARRNRSPVTQVAGDPGHAAWVVHLGLSGLGRKRPKLREPRLATGDLGRAPGLARLGSQVSPGEPRRATGDLFLPASPGQANPRPRW